MALRDAAWPALAVAAVLGFWALGARNRLVALRNAVSAAWAQADEAQRRRGEGIEQLVAALRAPLADEQGALDALWSAHAASARAAGAMSARPLAQANAAAWTEAERHLVAAATRVLALADGQAQALAGCADVQAARAAWVEAGERLRFARQLYNDAAAAHDEAIAVFPTSLLSPVFGLRAAGRL
ncbi:MAG: LemA family protein [Betaproteobacteria bacterium]|nr:LemA family protein [Betaproteobacteria bacterium]MCC6249062.1 LemA family protein [Rubrivivax sp.]